VQATVIALASTVAQPLLLLSGVLLPLTLAPQWMRTAAKLNLFAYVVDDGRALVMGHWSDASILPTFGASLIVAALAVLWAARVFRRAAA
jgi:ABC-2 type transport system permease protein